jgi:GT2 family glycosyltransferase
LDISIIVVNWNTKELLLKCLKSIYASGSQVSIEVIVVDNASTDGSADAVRESFPRVIMVVNPDNFGFAKANNVGIALATGRFIALCNSDIEVLGGAIGELVAYLDVHPGTGAVGPKTLNADRTLRKNSRRFPTLWNMFCTANFFPRYFPGVPWLNGTLMTDFDHATTRTVDVLPGCFFVIRKSVIEEAGALDDRYFIYGEDKDWCRRIKDAGHTVVFHPLAEVVHYTKGSSSKAPVRFMVEKIKANCQYWEKFHSRAELTGFIFVMRYHYRLRLVFARISLLFSRGGTAGRELQIKAFRACLYWLAHRHSTPVEIGMRFEKAVSL